MYFHDHTELTDTNRSLTLLFNFRPYLESRTHKQRFVLSVSIIIVNGHSDRRMKRDAGIMSDA